MNTNQDHHANQPIRRNLALIYLFSILIAMLMAVVSAAGILYRTSAYATEGLLRAFVSTLCAWGSGEA